MGAGSRAAAVIKAALPALLCAACTGIAADSRTFEGTRWHIAAINAVPTPPYPVEFSNGRMSGVICNRFEGPYRVGRDGLQLGGFMSTERGCSNPTMPHEESAFAVLHRPMRLHWRSGHRLTLSNSAGSVDLELVR